MKAWLILLAGALVAPASHATETEAPTFDPVVVTPTGTATPLSDSIASVTIISRDEIERAQAFDVAELLRFTAGVELGRSGGPGQQTSVFIRGANSNQTLVLIDGIRVNRLTSGGATLENITPDMIERIEIVRGPRATLYGSDAIGGVINIITRRARGGNFELSARAGSNSTLDGSGFGGYGGADSQISAHAQHQETDGIPAVAGQSQGSSFRQNSFEASGSTKLGGVRIGARGWDARSRAGYYAFNPVTFMTDLPASQSLHNTLVAVDVGGQPTKAWDSTLTLAEHLDRIEQRESADFLRSRRPSLAWHNVYGAPLGNRISFGLEAAQEDVEASTFGTPIAERRDLYSAFVENQLEDRGNHAVIGGSAQHNEAFGNHYNWNLEYGYDLPGDILVYTAADTGFRAPTAAERFGFAANPDLEPETARNYEIGARQQLGPGVNFDLRLFRMDVKNLINPICDDNFNCKLENVKSFRNQGIEAAWRVESAQWLVDVTAILQNPQDRSNGSQLLRRAKRSIAARLTRRFGSGYVAVDVLGTSRRPDVDLNTGAPLTDGGYALLNVGAGLKLGKHFRIEGRAENVLDADYQTAAGYNQPGLSGYGTLIYSY